MCDTLVARTGRHQQRYDSGFRLVAGCIPYRYRDSDASSEEDFEKIVEVLMINSPSGPGLLFPKVVLGCFPVTYDICWENRDQIQNQQGEAKLQQFGKFYGDAIWSRLSQRMLYMIRKHPGSAITMTHPGGWENDETDEQAAIREAIEEAGVRGKIMKFLGYYEFKSKTHQDECSPEGWCKAVIFAMLVEEELESWPEQNTRSRKWLTISEAADNCRHPWMRDALIGGFCKWHDEEMLPHVVD